MTVEEITTSQQATLSTEDLRPYAGQWVALRDGRVIEHALDPVTLRRRPGITTDDQILVVPDGDTGVFIL